jgi:hypothetical protein
VLAAAAAIGGVYSAIAINHFDAQLASLRATLENATARFETQASRIDAAYSSIADIKGSTGEIKATIEYMKGKIDKIEKIDNSLQVIQQDIDRIKKTVHADANNPTFTPALVAELTNFFSVSGLKPGHDFSVTVAEPRGDPSVCGLKPATLPKVRLAALKIDMQPQPAGAEDACFLATWRTRLALINSVRP